MRGCSLLACVHDESFFRLGVDHFTLLVAGVVAHMIASVLFEDIVAFLSSYEVLLTDHFIHVDFSFYRCL